MGRGEDGRVHGGAAEASVPGPAGGQGLGDRECVPWRGCDRAARGGDPGIPASTAVGGGMPGSRSEEHRAELQSRSDLVCRLLLEKKKKIVCVYEVCSISQCA